MTVKLNKIKFSIMRPEVSCLKEIVIVVIQGVFYLANLKLILVKQWYHEY